MTTLHEAARQALEALEQCGFIDTMRDYGKEADAIKALRAALAAPQAGPVGEAVADALIYQYSQDDKGDVVGASWNEAHVKFRDDYLSSLKPGDRVTLYTAPQPAAQEPSQPEFFAQPDYDKDFNVLVSVYRRRADATPVLVHQEPMKAQEAAPERVPLTDEQKVEEFSRPCYASDSLFDWFDAGVSFAERHHGITPKEPT